MSAQTMWVITFTLIMAIWTREIMSQCSPQISLKAKPSQTFSKGLSLTVRGIKASLRYHFRFSCIAMPRPIEGAPMNMSFLPNEN